MKAEFMCKCGERVNDLFECDICGQYHCSACYIEATKISGGLNVRNTDWNCCQTCAEDPEVQTKILCEAKALAGEQLILAYKDYRKKTNELAAVIDNINQAMKKIETEQKQKQVDLLTLGLLQEKNLTAAQGKKIAAQKAYIEELETKV